MIGYSLKKLFSFRNGTQQPASRQETKKSWRPRFEHLEDRLAPAVLDLTGSGASGVINGALFAQVNPLPTGSGVIDSFVRVQDNTLQTHGYNTNHRPLDCGPTSGPGCFFTTPIKNQVNSSNTFTRALPLASVPVVTIGGVRYREFLLDINEGNNTTDRLLSLDRIHILLGSHGDLRRYNPTTFTFGPLPVGNSSNLIYNMDAGGDNWVRLDGNLGSGSGQGDMRLFVPNSLFTGPNQFVYLYSRFGDQSSSNCQTAAFPTSSCTNESGFEEWAHGRNATPVSATGTIQGYKFNDLNNNGVDDNEPRLAGVTIFLDSNGNNMLDAGEVSTMTNASGAYSFTNLVAGLGALSTYHVREVAPVGATQTTTNPPGVVLTTNGQVVTQATAGYSGLAFGNAFANNTISGRKFEDLNGNGAEDSDPSLGGWTIFLDSNNNGTLDTGEPTRVTAADGSYTFNGLAAGTYQVREVQQSGWVQTTANPVVITFTGTNQTAAANFGNFRKITISGRKFTDADADGTGVGDANLSGVTITLYRDANGNSALDVGTDTPMGSMATLADGTYSFSDLSPGTYFVAETVPAGYTQTAPGSGYYTQPASSGTDAPNRDFGNFQNISISGTKYHDKTANGITADDTAMSGVTIRLYRDNTTLGTQGTLDAADAQIGMTTTAGDGSYIFSNLAPGTYFVQEGALPAGWTQTAPASGHYTVVVGDTGQQSGQNATGRHFANAELPPTITITKSANVASVPEGGVPSQSVVYTFTITNTSPAATDPVTITSVNDNHLGNLTSAAQTACGTLAQNASCTFSVTGTAPNQNAGTTFTNTVTANGIDDEGVATNTATAQATIGYTDVAPSISVAKSANPTTIQEGGVGSQSVTYTFTVTNTSAATTDPVTIQSLSDNQLGVLTGNVGCQVGTVLAKGASCSFTVTTTLAVQNAGYVHSNTFTATAKDDENTPTNTPTATATVTYTDVLPSISVAKSVNPTTISEGGVGNQTVTYTFTVTNTSAATTDPVTIQSLSDNQLGVLTGNAGCQVGTVLAKGASCSFTVTTTLGVQNAGYVHSNTFTATAKDDENNTVNNSASAAVTYTDVAPSISVAKSVSPKMVQENGLGNQSVTYTFTVTNTSAASTDPVTIQSLSDNVLGVLTGSASCQVGTSLAPGASCSFTLTTTVPAQAAGTTLTNTFTATGKDDENNSVSATANATVNYVGASITLNPVGTAVNPIDPGNGSSAHTFTANVTTTVPAGSGITVTNGNITITASNGATVTCNAATTCSLTVNSTVFTTITATATVSGISFNLGAETLSGVSRTSNTATKVYVDGRICGTKYRDLNTNGFHNPEIGEQTLQNWTIYLDSNNDNVRNAGERSTVTDANGKFCFFELPVGTYQVREEMQAGWITTTGDPIPATITFTNGKMDTWAALAGQTNPTQYHNERILYDNSLSMPNPELAIGNIPQLTSGPRTLGFWGNKNGRAILESIGVLAWTDTLLNMNLRNANGTHWDINYAGNGNTALCTATGLSSCHNLLRTWLLSGSATNMAYMLSVQLATMKLNTMAGGVSLSAQVYVTNSACSAGGRTCSTYSTTVSSDAADGVVDGKATIANVMNEANAQLALYGEVTTSTNAAQRAYFETLKNILDDGNNNWNWV